MQAALILAGAFATGAVSLALGQLLFAGLRLRLLGIERAALAFLAGSGLLSLTVFLLAAAGWARPPVYIAIGLAAMAAVRRRLFSFGRAGAPALERGWRIVAAALFGVFSWIYLLRAMAPEHSPDGSSYHLGLVSLYNEAGRLVKVTDNMYAAFPQAVEMLFLHAFWIGKHSSAALVEFQFLIALAALVYCFGRRFGHPRGGLLASFAVYASPIAGWTGTCAYIDIAVTAAIFGMFYLLCLWEEGRPDRVLIPAGLLAGFAFGSKYTAALAIPFGLAFIALVLWRRRRVSAVAPAAFLLAAVPMFSGWLIKNWLWIGNPVAPFLNRWFPNPYFFPSFEREYTEVMRWIGGLGGWSAVPLEVTVRGGAVQGIVGPLFLLAPLALLSLRSAVGRRLCAAALVFAATYPLNKGARFLLPALPFVALAMAAALAKYRRLTGALILGHAVASYPAVVALYTNQYAMRLGPTPSLAEAFRLMPEDRFLRGKRFGYGAARMVEDLVPPDKQVYSFVTFQEAYSRRKVIMYYASARANLVSETLFTALDAAPLFGGRPMASGVSPDLLPVVEMEYRFPPVKARAVRLTQPKAAGRLWVLTDARVFSRGDEIRLPPSARFTASHSRWYAGRAFDANPVTLWCSRENVRAGMYVEAQFGEELEVDRLTIRAPRDQGGLAPVLEVMAEGARWVETGRDPAVSVVPPPADLRALASGQLLRDGIDYLLVYESNIVADDFRERAAEWRVEKIGSSEDFSLYRILWPAGS